VLLTGIAHPRVPAQSWNVRSQWTRNDQDAHSEEEKAALLAALEAEGEDEREE
jgi:hypothetical protein